MKKFGFIYFALALLLSWGLAGANTNVGVVNNDPIITDQGGPDAFGYHWIDNDSAGGPTYSWVDISSIGVPVVGLADDNFLGPYSFGFNFPYYWYGVNRCWIGSNGYIEFSSGFNFAHPFADFPNAGQPNDIVACLTGDLLFVEGSQCFFYSNNSDSVVVSWINVGEFGAPESLHTFQVILAANDSTVTCQYGVNHGNFLDSSGGHRTIIGIENVNGGSGIMYIRDNVPSGHMWHEGLALKFYPVPDPNFVVHDFGVVDAFHTGSGADLIPSGAPYTVNVLVKNFGNQPETGLRTSCIIRRGTTIVYHDTLDVGNLNPGEQIWMTYPDPFQQDSATTYKVALATLMTGDQNSNNNTLNAELDVYRLNRQLRYCDDVAETGRSWTGDFSGFGVEYQVPEAIKVDSVYFNVNGVTANGPVYVYVIPADGNGNPDLANILAGDSIDVTLAGWYTVDFSWADLNFAANQKFFIAELHAFENTISFGMDQTAPLSYRGWEYTGGMSPDRDRALSDVSMKIFAIQGTGPANGTISGSVFGPDGTTPLADVTVNTYDIGNVLVGTDLTGPDGLFSLDVPAGTYHETFAKSGYQNASLDNIIVNAGQITPVSMTMQLSGGCIYIVGDINNNNVANGIDVVYAVGYFKGGPPPPYSCDCGNHGVMFVAGDVNGNCVFNGIDVTYFVGYLKGGPGLRPCPDCPPGR